jgi:hypothetical protein
MKVVRTTVCLGLAAGWLALGTAAISAQEIRISPATSSWSEQNGRSCTGQAFDCAAERCGRDLHLYLRAKIGFCRCATGVSDDDEIERVADLDLIGLDYKPLASGHPVSAGIMTGRARQFAVVRPLQPALPVLTLALSNKCNAIVATWWPTPRISPPWRPRRSTSSAAPPSSTGWKRSRADRSNAPASLPTARVQRASTSTSPSTPVITLKSR